VQEDIQEKICAWWLLSNRHCVMCSVANAMEDANEDCYSWRAIAGVTVVFMKHQQFAVQATCRCLIHNTRPSPARKHEAIARRRAARRVVILALFLMQILQASTGFPAQLAQAAQIFWRQLPKTGKPNQNEATCMAGNLHLSLNIHSSVEAAASYRR
jgi:hypothetical protein